MDLDRFCNFVWWWITRNASEAKDVDKVRARLWRPPAGEAVTHSQSPWSSDNETRAFAAFKAQTAN